MKRVLGYFIVFTLLMIYSCFSYGFVLTKFWGWYVLPIFTSLPKFGLYQAVGLSLTISLLKGARMVRTPKKEFLDDKRDTEAMFIVFCTPWLVLLMGYIMNWIIK